MLQTPKTKEIDSQPGISVSLGCQHCGCRKAFAVIAPAGRRSAPIYRCSQCGRERDDLGALAA